MAMTTTRKKQLAKQVPLPGMLVQVSHSTEQGRNATIARGRVVAVDDLNGTARVQVELRSRQDLSQNWYPATSIKLLVEDSSVLSGGAAASRRFSVWCVVASSRQGHTVLQGSHKIFGGYEAGLQLEESRRLGESDGFDRFRLLSLDAPCDKRWMANTRHPIGLFSVLLRIGEEVVACRCVQTMRAVLFLYDDQLTDEEWRHANLALVEALRIKIPVNAPCDSFLEAIRALCGQCRIDDHKEDKAMSLILEAVLPRILEWIRPDSNVYQAAPAVLWIVGLVKEVKGDVFAEQLIESTPTKWDLILDLLQRGALGGVINHPLKEKLSQQKLLDGWKLVVLFATKRSKSLFMFLMTSSIVHKLCPSISIDWKAFAHHVSTNIPSPHYTEILSRSVAKALPLIDNFAAVKVTGFFWLASVLCRDMQDSLSIFRVFLESGTVCTTVQSDVEKRVMDMCEGCTLPELQDLVDALLDGIESDAITLELDLISLEIIERNSCAATWYLLTDDNMTSLLARLKSRFSSPQKESSIQSARLDRCYAILQPKLSHLLGQAAELLTPPVDAVNKGAILTRFLKLVWKSDVNKDQDEHRRKAFTASAKLLGEALFVRYARLAGSIPSLLLSTRLAESIVSDIRRVLPNNLPPFLVAEYFGLLLSYTEGDDLLKHFRPIITDLVIREVRLEAHTGRASDRAHIIALLVERDWDKKIVGSLVMAIFAMEYSLRDIVHSADLVRHASIFVAVLKASRAIQTPQLDSSCKKISIAAQKLEKRIVTSVATIGEIILAGEGRAALREIWMATSTREGVDDAFEMIDQQLHAIHRLNALKKAYRSSVSPIMYRLQVVREDKISWLEHSQNLTPTEYRDALSACCFGHERDILWAHRLINSSLFETMLENETESADLDALEPSSICSDVIPGALEQLKRCATMMRDDALTCQQANLWLSSLRGVSTAAVQKELGGISNFVLAEWEIRFSVPNQLRLIDDFFFMDKCMGWLKLLIQLRNSLTGSLFLADITLEDRMYDEVTRFLGELDSTSKEDQLISSFSTLASKYRDYLKRLTFHHIEFLVKLLADEVRAANLLNWLAESSDNVVFRSKADLFRECVDDPVLLHALSCLVSIRAQVLQPLFLLATGEGINLFETLHSFVDALVKINIDASRVAELECVLETFGKVCNAMTSQALTPGVKAFWQLVRLRQRGHYVIGVGSEGTTGSPRVQAWIMHQSCDARKSSQDPDYEDVEETLELRELLKLHALLSMTEIQPELLQRVSEETGLDLHGAVASFRRGEVAVLASIDELIQGLAAEGHPRCVYNDSPRRFIECTEYSLSALTRTQDDLRQMKLSFAQIMEHSRRRFHFLNFFTINQLHRVAKVAIAASRGEHSALTELRQFFSFASRHDLDPLALADSEDVRQIAFRFTQSRLDSDESIVEYFECLDTFIRRCALFDKGFASEKCLPRELLRRLNMEKGQESESVILPEDELWVALHDSNLRKYRPVAICTLSNENDALEALWGIYARLGGIPEPSEVLLCESSTTLEDLDVFFYRWAYSDARDWLFALVGVEKLSSDAQTSLSDRLLTHRCSSQRESAFLVLIHSGGSSSKAMKNGILNALAPMQVAIQVPTNRIAALAIRRSLEFVYGSETVYFVESQRSGSGKTQFIREKFFKLTQDAALVPVMIGEGTTREELGSRLTKAFQAFSDRPVSSPTMRLVHIDVAHRTPHIVTNMLVELLVLGRLTWSSQISGRLQCHSFLRRPGDVFAFELQLSEGGRPQSLEVLSGSLFCSHVIDGTPSLEFCARHFELVQEPHLLLRVIKHRVQHHRAVAASFLHLESTKQINTTMILGTHDEPRVADANIVHFRGQMNIVSPEGSMRGIDAMAKVLSMWAIAMDQWALCYPGILDDDHVRTSWRAVFASLVRSTALLFARRRVPQIIEKRTGQHSLRQQVERLEHIQKFDREPLLLLKRLCGKNDSQGMIMQIAGIEILSFDQPQLLATINEPVLVQILQHNGLDLSRDWSRVSHEEAVRLLLQADGQRDDGSISVSQCSAGYIFSIDNFIKMLIVHTRLSAGIPVLVIGETGVGKSSLFEEMCRILAWPLATLRVHGGVTRHDVETWMLEHISLAHTQPEVRRLIFLDEINTADCMSVFKQIVCDRMLQGLGSVLPSNLHVVAACNPYRLKSKAARLREERDGLLQEAYLHETSAVKYRQGSGPFRDPLRHLVYRVHELPDALLEFVFDFGALSSDTEAIYIDAMLLRKIPSNPHLARSLSSMLHHCQEVSRDVHEGERSVVSLRDVSRFLGILEWSLKNWQNFVPNWDSVAIEDLVPGSSASRSGLLASSIATATLFCYYSRLTFSQRQLFLHRMKDLLNTRSPQLDDSVQRVWKSNQSWEQLVNRVQSDVVDAMGLGPGIARNSAIKENVMMLFVAIMSRTPIIVVGKPGSSKSLAMALIRSSVRGPESRGPLSKFPAVTVFSYQCSPLSTSQGIEKVFSLADQTLENQRGSTNTRTIQVILLDEIGLAEQSPHLPLKVLHKLLDERSGRVAVVGLSNWALDPAKMNRAVHLFRPAPTEPDLCETARALTTCVALRRYLANLAQAYYRVYQSQAQDDFFGLRDFYSLIRTLAGSLDTGADSFAEITPPLLLEAVLRNFAGRPQDECVKMVTVFFEVLGMGVPAVHMWPTVEQLVSANLASRNHSARHLLLISRNAAALDLLFERQLVEPRESTVIIGSDFPGDRDEMLQYDALEKIRCCMSVGHTVVLVHCEQLYESLYDVLNQHYTAFGDQMYTRLAFGPESQPCYISDKFRLCVVVEAKEAYSNISPALLNRFEKQVLDWNTLLTMERHELMNKLTTQVLKDLSLCGTLPLKQIVAGYNQDMLASLVQLGDESMSTLTARLLQVCSPEAFCLLAQPKYSEHRQRIQYATGVDPVECYFEKQTHCSLERFLDDPNICHRTRILTYSACVEAVPMRPHSVLVLHGINTEKELKQVLTTAVENAELVPLLLIQCDVQLSTRRRILQTQYALDECSAKGSSQLPLQVVFLLHLSRREEAANDFLLDFCDRWTTIFIDELHPNDSATDMPTLSSASFARVLGTNMLDLVQAMRRCFRRSILRMVYPFRRTNQHIRKQIELLDSLICSEPRFVDLVRKFGLKVIQQRKAIGAHVAFLWNVLERHSQTCSLRHAFETAFDLIVEKLFGMLLAYLEENSCLALLNDELNRDFWFSCAESSLLRSDSTGIRYEAAFCNDERLNITTFHENRPSFESKFPFSVGLHRLMSSLRKSWHMLADQSIESLKTIMPWQTVQVELSSPLTTVLIHDIFFFEYARCGSQARHLQDGVQVQGAATLPYLLSDLESDPTSLASIYVTLWRHDRVIDAFFEVVRHVVVVDWNEKLIGSTCKYHPDGMVNRCVHIAIDNVSWAPEHAAARLAIQRLIEVSEVVAPPKWAVIKMAARIAQEAPHCELDTIFHSDQQWHWSDDPLKYEFPLDAYLVDRCDPARLVQVTAAAVDASLLQCLNVLHAISNWYSPGCVNDVLVANISQVEEVSSEFNAACILFLSEQKGSVVERTVDVIPLDAICHQDWPQRIDHLSSAHALITTVAMTLDTVLLNTCDINFFVHSEGARWLFWRSLAREHSVAGVERILHSGTLNDLQLSALHDVRLLHNAPRQPAFNPFGCHMDPRVYAAASCGGRAMDVLVDGWTHEENHASLSLATFWWSRTVDLSSVPLIQKEAVMGLVRSRVIPLDGRGMLWGMPAMDPLVELLVVHVCIMAASGDGKRFSLWSPLLNQLSSTNLLPAQPDDVTHLVVAAAGGSMIYECANGHAYVIGQCGMPMQTSTCATCGAAIGGNNHVPLAGNRQVTLRPTQVLCGYRLGRLSLDNCSAMYGRDRGHGPIVLGALRALLHVAMLVHTDCRWVADTLEDAMAITNEFGSWRGYIVHQLTTDLSQIATALDVEREEVAAMLTQLSSALWTHYSTVRHSFENAQSRHNWEIAVAPLIEQCVNADIGAQTIANLPVLEQGRNGIHELLEGLRSTSDIANDDNMFWRPTWKFTSELLEQLVARERLKYRTGDAVCELVSFVLENKTQLGALEHVPGAVSWLNLCHAAFDLRLTPTDARGQTINEVLKKKADVLKWKNAQSMFEPFAALWNKLFPEVEYECLDIPQQLRLLRMEASVSLVFSLLSDQDEGLCARAVLQRAQQLHNRFVLLSRAVVAMNDARDEDWIPLRLVDGCHITHLDVEDVYSYTERACFNPCTAKQSNCIDLSKLARWIANRTSWRPLIACQLPAIRFLGRDSQTSPALQSQLQQLLRSSVDIEFRPVHRLSLEQELHNSDSANRDLQTLQTVLQFIVDTQEPCTDLADLKLEKYGMDVLRLPQPVFTSSVLVSTARLKHGCWLLRKLAMLATDDPTSGVLPRYRHCLGSQLESTVDSWRASIGTSVVTLVRDTLSSICSDYLTQGNLNDEEQLCVLFDLRDELEGIKHVFPTALLCKHAVSVVKRLRQDDTPHHGTDAHG
jgi:hypothetical protein